MARAQPHACVAVIVLVEQEQVTPVRVFLKLGVPAETRPVARCASFED